MPAERSVWAVRDTRPIWPPRQYVQIGARREGGAALPDPAEYRQGLSWNPTNTKARPFDRASAVLSVNCSRRIGPEGHTLRRSGDRTIVSSLRRDAGGIRGPHRAGRRLYPLTYGAVFVCSGREPSAALAVAARVALHASLGELQP